MKTGKLSILTILFLGLLYCNPGQVDYQEKVSINQTIGQNYGDVTSLLRTTFRIDISNISVNFEYFPNSFFVNCEAELRFSMYDDSQRPIFHLTPFVSDSTAISRIELNGETLDPSNSSDIRLIDIEGSSQQAIECQRYLNSGIDQRLVVHYRINLSENYYMFSTQVSDLYGRGNEQMFPTINRPAELARHQFRFKINGDMRFRFLGSGLVTDTSDNSGQSWTLDTEREVASYTVMFVLFPEADTLLRRQTIDGVDVQIMAFSGGASIDTAIGILQSWLPELRQNIGDYPMPRGLSIFLTNGGGGMEYYGATISSIRALRHEIFHMYFACSTVNKTYRDSWFDEAVNEWYEHSGLGDLSSIPDNYSSNIVSGRSPVQVGFDGRAYTEGAQILHHIALNMGGRQAMIGFLQYLHKNYIFKPFTTAELLKYLQDYSGLDYRSQFENWVYSGETGTHSPQSKTSCSTHLCGHNIDMLPPPHILKKYRSIRIGEKQ